MRRSSKGGSLAEGTPYHYVRTTVCFSDAAGADQNCQVYLAHPDQLVAPQNPEPDYLAYIERGYQQHGFDDGLLDNYM